jgi:hypothetical protein
MTAQNIDGRVSWPPYDEIDGETQQLMYLVEEDWYWAWPGWQHIADRLNAEYGNKRTPQSCRAKYGRVKAQILEKYEDS